MACYVKLLIQHYCLYSQNCQKCQSEVVKPPPIPHKQRGDDSSSSENQVQDRQTVVKDPVTSLNIDVADCVRLRIEDLNNITGSRL